MGVQRLSHIGICVSDLERSVHFYRDVLGFVELNRFSTSGEQSAQLTEIEGGAIDAVYLEREGTRIELLHYPEAGVVDGETPRPMNRPGLTHLSLRVDSFDEVISQIEAAGGTNLEYSRVENKEWNTKAIFVTDPDGLRIELLDIPGDPNSLPGG